MCSFTSNNLHRMQPVAGDAVIGLCSVCCTLGISHAAVLIVIPALYRLHMLHLTSTLLSCHSNHLRGQGNNLVCNVCYSNTQHHSLYHNGVPELLVYHILYHGIPVNFSLHHKGTTIHCNKAITLSFELYHTES